MFLRRNVAGQTFVIPGSLRALADGAAVTTGATLTVVRDGTVGAAAGTLAHIAGGAYRYTPTATETDCAILGYVLEGTGAVTVCGSIRTTQADPNDAAALGLTRLDAAVSTRLATASYTAPPSIAGLALEASVQTVRAKTDNLPLDPADASDIAAAFALVNTQVWTSPTRTLTAFTIPVALSAAGLDAIPVTPPAGAATTFREMIVQTWRRFFRRHTKSATQIRTFADDNATALTTQVITAVGTDETVGAA